MYFEEENFDSAINIVSPLLKSKLAKLNCIIKNDTYEIRMRVGKPIVLFGKYGYLFLKKNGEAACAQTEDDYICNPETVSETFNRLCSYSVYSHIGSIVNGFITYQGGHRAGISGTAVTDRNGNVSSVTDISSVNIRIARQIKGAADDILRKTGFGIGSVIIAGPPSSGKTTVLRDLVRQISDRMIKVCIIDERQEIACMNGSMCQHDVGLNTDVLNNFPKTTGIINAVKTMSPDIIALDETAVKEETDAIIRGVSCGVDFIVSVHVSDYEDLLRRPLIKELTDTGAFQKIILLSNSPVPGNIQGIYDVSEVRDEIYRSRFAMGNIYDDWDKGVVVA